MYRAINPFRKSRPVRNGISNWIKFLTTLLGLGLLGSLIFLYQSYSKPLNTKVGPQHDIQSVAQRCYEGGKSPHCYQEAAVSLLNNFSLEEILAVFESHEIKNEFFTSCHQIAHYLGQEEYKRTKDLRKVFSKSSRACLGGTFHGAVEGYFMEKRLAPNDKNVAEEVRVICGKRGEYKRIQEFIECNHGLGHAVMFFTDYTLPQSLRLCNHLNSREERELCYTGTFMANADSLKSNEHPSLYIKENDPLYPCPILDKSFQKICYTYATLSRFQFDLDRSINICKRIPEEYRNDCFETVGRDRTMVSADPREIKTHCSKISRPVFQDRCIAGAAYNLVIRFGIDSYLPIDFCSIVDRDNKNSCYKYVGQALKTTLPNLQLAVAKCDYIIVEKYRKVCRVGVNN